MKKDEFAIGLRFFLGDNEYQCTDIGTRTIVAVEITDTVREDPSWLNGPTYALLEVAFDEDDIEQSSLVDNRDVSE